MPTTFAHPPRPRPGTAPSPRLTGYLPETLSEKRLTSPEQHRTPRQPNLSKGSPRLITTGRVSGRTEDHA
ncbi:hypothetical protein LZ31DRAFT_551679 [Colletotrichum somersetense]|nr:hypothetical protein LZ31DRAFT_551679 [Colletotrichum somersetense]